RSVGRHGFLDFTRVPPPEPAETTITDPFTGGTVPAGTSTRFEGRASAASEVRRVQVELRNLDNRRYLQDDGTSWSTTFNQFTATLEQLNATETGWSFEAILPAGEYQLRARAIGKDGTQDSTWATARFDSMLIGDLPPETSIALPPSGQVSTLTFLVSGTARDDSGVMRLSMFARNANTGAYLQDDWTARATWHSFPITPDNPGDPSVTWSYEVTMPEGEWDVNVSASDDAGQSEIRGASRTYFVSATNVAPTVTMTTPAPNTVVTPGSTLFIAGTASDDTALRRVEVYVRNRQTREGMAVDGSWGVPDWHLVTPTSLNVLSTSWTVTTPPLPAGSYEVRAQAIDGHGVTTPSSLRPNITVMSAVAGDAQPDTTLSFTGTTQDIETLTLPITGTATDDRGVGGVRLVVSDSVTGRYLASPAGGFTSAYTMLPASLASPGATSTGFSLTLPLGVPGTYNVTAIAQDNAGQWDTATTGATARYLIYPGDAVPYLDLDSPDPEQVVTNFITFGGRAHDDVGVQRVQVRVVNSAGYSLNSTGTFVSTETWITAFVTNPGGTGSNFNYATPNLAAGPYTAYARAIDSVGQVQPTPNRATVQVVLG
ncbi:MAG TPA: Ig-like domain-containing protein, partial [Acidimicrobiia bacterium]|nr:Ig-like domain-containing protein [Acidimicrobiia bacterium]